jgi:ABC-type nitrate/sulfonate/bicarbonate transport system substrate-binding protein
MFGFRTYARSLTVVCLVLGAQMAMNPARSESAVVRVGKAQAENFTFIPLDVGVATGAFEKRGLKIEATNFAGSAKLQQALAADAIDIGLGSGPELAFVAKGAPVIGVAAMADAPYVGNIVVLKDGPIKTPADLKGKTISVSSKGSLSDWLAMKLSQQQGWGEKGIATVSLGDMTSQVAALKTHQIDGMSVEPTTAFRLEDEGTGRILVNFGTLIKDFHIHVMYARREFIAKHPDEMRAFLAAWIETLPYMKSHKDETVAIASKAVHVAPSTMTRVYDLLMPAFNYTGRFNDKALNVLGDSFLSMGILKTKPDMRTLVNETFLPN